MGRVAHEEVQAELRRYASRTGASKRTLETAEAVLKEGGGVGISAGDRVLVPHYVLVNRFDPNQGITILLEDWSICQLDFHIGTIPPELQEFKIDRLLWFTRLKAKREGIGAGSFMMRELVKILDANGLWVLNCLNPYGRMSMEELTEFYKKFGFEEFAQGGMYRRPRAAT